MPPPRFVAVGHVTLDHTDAALRPGGAPLYAPLAAHRLGCAVSLLTSFGPDFPADVLPAGIEVHRVPARRTTAFRLERTPSGRELTLLHRAADLHAAHLPAAWRAADMALLCPVANEVDPLLAAEFPEGAVGAAVQGWLRAPGAGGTLAPARWEAAPLVLPHVQAVFLT